MGKDIPSEYVANLLELSKKDLQNMKLKKPINTLLLQSKREVQQAERLRNYFDTFSLLNNNYNCMPCLIVAIVIIYSYIYMIHVIIFI